MLLAKSGERAEPLLQEALTRRQNLPTVLTVLGSIGDPALIPQLRRFADDRNPEVAKAAQEALKVIEFQEDLKFRRESVAREPKAVTP